MTDLEHKTAAIVLNEEQSQALAVLREGGNLFLTGPAGTGKTATLNEWLKDIDPGKVAVTASTGIAASHLRGMTINRFCGMGILNRSIADIVKTKYFHEVIGRQIREVDIVVIDEISMLDGRAFHYVDHLCRAARMDSSTPFGGLQVVVVGDFAQLPPVELDEHGFAFESDSWAQAKFRTVELTRVMRARGDEWYVWLLRCLRQGTLPPEARRILEQRHHAFDPETAGEDGAGATRLMTHNRDVDYINQKKLDALAGEKFTYKAVETGETELLEMIDKGCGSPRNLELKVGARVMFTRNDQGGRWVNGTLGVVTELKPMPEKTPLSEPDDDLEYVSPIRVKILGEEDDIGVEPAEWTTDKKVVDQTGKKTEAGDPALRTVSAIRRQFPLRLAWAVTIHRAQGATLPLVSVNLRRTFAPGQAYVALSRARSLYGLNIEDWDPFTSIFAHPRALALRSTSLVETPPIVQVVALAQPPPTAQAPPPVPFNPLDHMWHKREDGLLHCKVCNGAEGSLPTDCPGDRMDDRTEIEVYDGVIDFVGGKWIEKKKVASTRVDDAAEF